MLRAAAGEKVPKALFSSFKGILNVHADTAAFHSWIGFHYSWPAQPLGSGAGRSPYTLRIHSQAALTQARHRARRRGGTPGLSLSGVTDLPRCEAAAVTKRAVFYGDLCESWRVISPSRFIRAIGNPGGGACPVVDRKQNCQSSA